ncbi:hypothetical protein WJX73_009711 [Symbiochloris irregularis]|uniref:Cleft lip and palate associated transmembrane protein n=1 Tax=Symbiochloris irregularis TaxID=706552 RepID=A0AAW1NSM4_9CHLO
MPDTMLVPKFQRGFNFDLTVFLSESEVYDLQRGWNDQNAMIWQERELALGQFTDRVKTVTYRPSKAVQNNGTLFLHTFFHPAGSSLDADDPYFDDKATFSRSHQVNAYLPAAKRKKGTNLLSGEAAEPNATLEEEGPRPYISYFKPNTSIALIDDVTPYPLKEVPAHISPYLEVDEASLNYFPVVYFNEFWLLRDKLVALNETVEEIELHLDVYRLAMWKFTLYNQMEESFSMQKNFGAMADGESDEFKRVLIEGNPYFLALTFSVSILHSVFDMLAFKNDIGFWRGKKNVEGLSVRTIGINCFCQVIVFLYLLDNETSMVILLSSGVGLAIEFWKVTKAMDVSFDRSGRIPRLRFKDKQSYTAGLTKEYDRQAMQYLSYALYPLVIGYAVYALIYESHKSWYSWILNSLVGAVYTFGFILMCPQLYLNYKLKSVAHLPWRQMSYKFLNTIIDDLFAFVIKMPTLHRLSVFRDDLVFLVYIYQRWIYRVDRKRANEFGYSAEQPIEETSAIIRDQAARNQALPSGPGMAESGVAVDAVKAAAADASAVKEAVAGKVEELGSEAQEALRRRRGGDAAGVKEAEGATSKKAA